MNKHPLQIKIAPSMKNIKNNQINVASLKSLPNNVIKFNPSNLQNLLAFWRNFLTNSSIVRSKDRWERERSVKLPIKKMLVKAQAHITD